ncbi:TonB family protein [Flavobacterium artemisiae]|uniref:TonB family protein n=1 Tax=Flavobacterium artemisiae TaxID=2126556 RepID=A0ABW4HE11_9FLAO
MWIFSQNSTDKIIYFDSIGKDASKEKHISYRIIKDYYTEKDLYQVKDYYKSGAIKMEGNSKTKDGFSREGEYVYYFENGKKKRTENYLKSRLNGDFEEWYENGNPRSKGEYLESEKGFTSDIKIYDFWNSKNEHTVEKGNGFFEEDWGTSSAKGNLKKGLKDGEWKGINEITKSQYTEIYKNGKFISGKSINSDGKELEYDALELKPLPQKGINDFYKYLGDHFVKTREAATNKIGGRLVIQFVIDKDGKIVEPKILKSLGYGLDEEAIRVITNYENWIPGKQRGVPVRVLYAIPLTVPN